MSRRIIFWGLGPAIALAAAAVLPASPVLADRECFENSCRMPIVAEPAAAQPATPAAGDEHPRPEIRGDDGPREVSRAINVRGDAEVRGTIESRDSREVRSSAERGAFDARGAAVAPAPRTGTTIGAAPSPRGIHPRMTSEQSGRNDRVAPRRNVDMGPPRDQPRSAHERRAVSAVPHDGRPHRRDRTVIVNGPPYTTTTYAAPDYAEPVDAAPDTVEQSGPEAVAVPDAYYPDDGVIADYPDPSWKLCQINERGAAVRYYRCGPYSYHPYGAHGYRPYGDYRAYRAEPAYVVVPNAKIISLKPRY